MIFEDTKCHLEYHYVSKVAFCFLVFCFSLGTFGELYANVNGNCFSFYNL